MSSIQTEVVNFTLPSGVPAKGLELTVEDIDRILSGKQPEQTMNDILRRVVIVNPDTPQAKPFDPVEATIADFFTAMVMVRRCTHGDKFIFKTECEECGHKWRHTVDLSDDRFQPKAIKWSDGADLASGVDPQNFQFVAKLARPHDGIEAVRLRLFQGKHQAALEKIRKNSPERKMSEQLRIRIVGLEGHIDPATKDRPPATQVLARPSEAWIRSLPVTNMEHLQRQVEAFDGGIESTTSIVCPVCNFDNEEASVPFIDKDSRFLSSRSAGTRSGEK